MMGKHTLHEADSAPCDNQCGHPGELCIDPYDSDVNNRVIWVHLCEDCYGAAVDAI